MSNDTSAEFSNDTSAESTIKKNKPKSLRVSVFNFQSIWNKRAILSTFLSENDIDVLIGSETHLTKDILNSEILPSNYIATRKDRDDGFRGIAIIKKNNIMVEDIHFQNCELVAIKIEMHEKPIVVCACYRPPNCDNSINVEIINNISRLC